MNTVLGDKHRNAQTFEQIGAALCFFFVDLGMYTVQYKRGTVECDILHLWPLFCSLVLLR